MATSDASETVNRSTMLLMMVGDAVLPDGVPVPDPPGAVEVAEAEFVLLKELEVTGVVLTTF